MVQVNVFKNFSKYSTSVLIKIFSKEWKVQNFFQKSGLIIGASNQIDFPQNKMPTMLAAGLGEWEDQSSVVALRGVR